MHLDYVVVGVVLNDVDECCKYLHSWMDQYGMVERE